MLYLLELGLRSGVEVLDVEGYWENERFVLHSHTFSSNHSFSSILRFNTKVF